MVKEFNRSDRLGDAIQRYVAHLIQFEINDPRVGMVNINDVEVSRDLASAKIFITFVDKSCSTDGEVATQILNKASGYLRSLLAKQLDARITPKLLFIYDQTAVKGRELSNLIDRAMAEDRANTANRDGGKD